MKNLPRLAPPNEADIAAEEKPRKNPPNPQPAKDAVHDQKRARSLKQMDLSP